MHPSLTDSPALSRRGLLKLSLGASAFLATAGLGASLSGCSSSAPANGFAVLRDSDLPFLRALVPVMLDGAVTADGLSVAVDRTLRSLDHGLDHLSPEMLKLTRQLFDVLAMGVTRGPLTGIWGAWENASADDIRRFLDRWQNSSLSLLRMGHASILQLVMMAWYGCRESWGHCGYPGPPTV
ncbi:twin-arginine translocation pathway signal protein [Pseudomonas sp. SZMC_28357]|uniref:twin-arginine translocation pathway signal protein n=1 Tax=Pseudomonas sp. SZMC_28357 TaxID=3074380 RepID=UPI002871904C|nr:twin-arginine translocation pathway signal protein [Pseudomonas sp. SZMC_28357]MDR9750805.1 twin-arginine translocation pathway signal protein [Pseudomonas sp. SZMC_28357]